MKKIFAISLIAMTAVTSARADIASQAYVDQQTGTLTNLTTTAQSNLVAAINEVDADITRLDGDAETTGSVAKKIADALAAVHASSALQGVKVNGTALTPVDGVVDVTVPTGALASKSTIADADVASDAAIAQSKIANLTTDLSSKAAASDLTALTTLVGTLPQGATATTVTGYIDEKAAAAATAGVNALDYTGATGGNVITQVTQTDGAVTATMGTAIMKTDTFNANGTYVLTATRSGTEGNYTYTYQWENITRGN